MLSEEEKKAIEIVKKIKNIKFNVTSSFYSSGTISLSIEEKEAIETALNLITKLQKEIEHQKEKRENQKGELAILNEKQKEMNKLINTVSSYKGMVKKEQKDNEKKDKIIDLMADYIFQNIDAEEDVCNSVCVECKQETAQDITCINCIKQYFEKLAKEKGE